eukprot:gb/GECG01006289.1/.p1 GENE.gb/GECG01006289.1/~~gb/GECG01006289.1/.p1  ORF type:complete len:370 (+),score=30.82 gb/GECG01006289.1/:1-1110(+)
MRTVMKFETFLLVPLLLSPWLVDAVKAVGARSRLQNLAQQFQGAPIPFHDSNFTEVVDEDATGQYDTAVVFTVGDTSRYQCGICPEAVLHFTLASRSYSIDIPYEQQDLFFGISTIESAPGIFQKKEINAVPFVVYYPTKSGGESKMIEMGDPNGFSARTLLDYFGRQHVRVYPNPARFMPLGTFATLIMAILASVISAKPHLVKFWKNHSFWYLGSLAMYGCAISGVISCIIRGVPWTTFDSNGRVSPFSDQSGSQTIVEGIFMASLLFASAFAIIMLHKIAVNRGNSDLLKVVGCAVCMGLFAAVFTNYVKIFQKKQGWVSFGDMIPAEVYAIMRLLHSKISGIIFRYTGIQIPYSLYSSMLGLKNY